MPRRAGRLHRAWGLAVLVLTCVGACSRAPTVDRNAMVQPLDDLSITRDVAYAPGDRHGLDIYVQRAAAPPRPVVVYLHGGGWISGSKAEFAWVGATLARQGYVAVTPDYRIHPQARWPNFLQDNAAAVRWARDHAAEFGGDPKRLFLMGHSAGAYNAVSLALDPRWLKEVGLDPVGDLSGVVALSGVFLITPDTPKQLEIFAPENRWPEMQPANHVGGSAPPILLGVGDKDEEVAPTDTLGLGEKLQAAGGRVRIAQYPGLGHAGPLEALVSADGAASQTLQDIRAFIDRPKG